mgnify:CR=1 FL=1
MRTQVTTAAAVLMLCAPGNASAQSPSVPKPGAAAPAAAPRTATAFAGTWRAAPFETRLASDFDVSVWGPNAVSVRTVELGLRPTGEGTLTVTTRVLDARRRTVPASTSIEEAKLTVGAAGEPEEGRTDYSVTVASAERRYPDDPGHAWPLDGLKIRLSTLGETAGSPIEIRYETPEGKGSFWETLRRAPRAAAAARR